MPPKKKSKPPTALALSPSTPSTTPNLRPPSPILSDGWTDEQETTLFKAIAVYKLKPAGMHKHFRIIAISELMKNHGVSGEHTGCRGIWEKLGRLWNLELADEREEAEDEDEAELSVGPGYGGSVIGESDRDKTELEDEAGRFKEFVLPADLFGDMMWERRLDPKSRDSPPLSTGEKKKNLMEKRRDREETVEGK
ncbi:chromatin modification-related protein EAF7-domain-containing protein [Pyronema omphalodes]|nr:chromatin modification-related protein EAF7-domain-containing protein [Pyronema omphalodes]